MPFDDADWAPAADIAKPEAQAAQKTADAATTKADAAQTTADTATNKADAAQKTADATEQHFWADTDGAHVSETGDHDLTGSNLLLTSAKLAIRKAIEEIASFGYDLIELGKDSASAVITMCGGKLRIAYEKAFSNTPSSIIQATSGDLWLRSDKGDVRLVSITDSDKALGGYVEAVGTRAQLRSDESSGMSQAASSGLFAVNGSNVVISVNGGAEESYPLDNLRYAISCTVLFDGSTVDNITLPESAANFSDIRIYYNVNGQCRGSVDVHSPDGKDFVQLHGMFQATDTIAQYRFRSLHIYGTHIDTQSSGYANFNTSGGFGLKFDDNRVLITRIVGWR